jgi:hypothetical protein
MLLVMQVRESRVTKMLATPAELLLGMRLSFPPVIHAKLLRWRSRTPSRPLRSRKFPTRYSLIAISSSCIAGSLRAPLASGKRPIAAQRIRDNPRARRYIPSRW